MPLQNGLSELTAAVLELGEHHEQEFTRPGVVKPVGLSLVFTMLMECELEPGEHFTDHEGPSHVLQRSILGWPPISSA